METSVCRFCGEIKPIKKMFNLQTNLALNGEIKQKVSFLRAVYINLCEHENYPTAVCFVCYESLRQAFDFLKRVEQSQNSIWEMLSNQTSSPAVGYESPTFVSIKIEVEEQSDKEQTVLPADTILPDTEVKREISNPTDINCGVIVKVENYEDTKSESKMQWICRYCGMESNDIRHLREHAKSMHKTCNAFKCPMCENCSEETDFNCFISHIQNRVLNLREYCFHCNEHFTSATLANAHAEQHLMRKYMCNECGEIFKDMTELQEHQLMYSMTIKAARSAIEQQHKYYLFNRSEQTYLNRDPLVVPKTSTSQEKRHSNEGKSTCNAKDDKLFNCEFCEKQFRWKKNLRVHIKKHEGKLQFPCDQCQKPFVSRSSLNRHIKVVHDKIPVKRAPKKKVKVETKDHICGQCGKAYAYKYNLKTHLKLHEEEQNLFDCNICNKSFRYHSSLLDHITLHTDEKKFECHDCGKRFKNKRQVRWHIILTHIDNKPYSCELCSKQYQSKYYLNIHLLQHKGEKLFPCDTCNKLFVTRAGCEKHFQRIHVNKF